MYTYWMLTSVECKQLLEIQTNNLVVYSRSYYSFALYSLIFPTGCLLGCVTLWGHDRRSAKTWTETLKSGGKLKQQLHSKVHLLQFQSEWIRSLRVLLQNVMPLLKLMTSSLQTQADEPHIVSYYKTFQISIKCHLALSCHRPTKTTKS